MVKNLPANAGDKRDAGSILGSERSPGEENGNPLQDSCLENPMDRGTRRAIVHGITKSQIGLSDLAHTRARERAHTHTHTRILKETSYFETQVSKYLENRLVMQKCMCFLPTQ